ncbi:RNA-binding domain-containing protein [Phanerochaete sordida]|uniref:RNA-binding domain-containing protein n=1 Tax=Phanerochaete sordida TaxID=48140 RepID=A0A9P3GRC9_9APHY|nr:RNA-binding domain-containing protein [Phanerochaete sordida]
MSDLDADLYGDLYGNDEAEYSAPPEQPEPVVKEETRDSPVATRAATPPPSKPAAATLPTPSPPKVEPDSPSAEQISLQPTSPDDSGFANLATQQIPTYQDNDSSEYREPPPNRQDQNYAGAANRPVRPSEMKEEGKMFIGGLNWDTTDESLRKYFTQFGKVEACTIMRDAAGRSRCFAFLTFEDPASVNAVMVREHFLDGKIIDPKRAIPRQEHQRATKLFIGGLAGSVTSESMREFFSQFGKVVDATVMLDRETGRSKGFGFVSFENVNVEPLLGFGNLEIDGKVIDVKLAQPRSQREGGFTQEGQTNNRGNFNGGGAGFQGGNFAAGGAGGAAAGGAVGGNAPFDPQALANLYTRMLSQMGGMSPMMGGMNPMMGGMAGGAPGYAGPMAGGMRMPMGAQMGGPGMMGMGAMGMPGMGMGRGAPGMPGGMMGGAMNPNVPRGPRGAPTGPGGAGVGPQRAGQRGAHNYHPYAR